MIDIIVAHKFSANDQYLLTRLLASVAYCDDLSPDFFESIVIVSDSVDYVQTITSQFTRMNIIVVEDKALLGVYHAFEFGFSFAKANYCVFFGIDDIILPDILNCRQILSRNYHKLIVMNYLHQSHGFVSQLPLKIYLVFRNWCQQSIIYKCSVLREMEPIFRKRYSIQADHDLHIRLMASIHSDYIHSSRDPLCVFASGGISSQIVDSIFKRDMHLILRTNFGYGYMFLSFARSFLGFCKRNLVL